MDSAVELCQEENHKTKLQTTHSHTDTHTVGGTNHNSFPLEGHVNAGAADFVAGAERRDNELIPFSRSR